MSPDWPSIENGMTPSTALATVELRRAYIPEAPALVIEGPDDLKLFNKLTREDCIVVPAGNRDGVVDAIQRANDRGMGLVLGVIDRDYADFREEERPDNLVMTDFNDIEVMLILSAALSSFVLESLGHQKCTIDVGGRTADLASYVLAGVSIIGQLRLVKHEQLPNLNFNGLRFRNHLAEGSLTLKAQSVTDELARRSRCAPSADELDRMREEVELRKIPATMLACGHDAVQYLCIVIESGALGAPLRRFGERDCAALMRSAYHPTDFRRSGLCRSIVEWCSQNNAEMLVSEALPEAAEC